jgi:uncharacterized membrane protein YeiH
VRETAPRILSAVAGLSSLLPDVAGDTPVWLSLAATAVGALEGSILARNHSKRLDIAGVFAIALSLGFGGGVIRDILIGNTPPEALRQWQYIAIVITAVAVTLVFGHLIVRLKYALFFLDSMTLGLFAAVGAQYAIDFRLPEITAIFVGAFASVAGGILASLLLGETPRVLQPGPPYAIATVIGSIAFVALDGVNGGLASFACIAVVFLIRFASERWGLRTTPIAPVD